MSTTTVLDERPVTCDDEGAAEAPDEARALLIDGGEFAIDPADMF